MMILGIMHECALCHKRGNMGRHHVIYGKGKKKAFETEQSKVFICYQCHELVHSGKGQESDLKLKLQLQADYFKMGKAADEVEKLMDGKLYLVLGEIWGMNSTYYNQ
jgi:hypothetical protein